MMPPSSRRREPLSCAAGSELPAISRVRSTGTETWRRGAVPGPAGKVSRWGPLVADDRAGAEAVLDALVTAAGGGEFYLDAPEPNREAVTLAQSRGLAPVFETARMYTG